MTYHLTIVKQEPLTEEQRETLRKSGVFEPDWRNNKISVPKSTEEVLSVELTETEWQAVKKGVLEVM